MEELSQDRLSGDAQPRTVLIASSAWWAFPARLAMAFSAAGYKVEAVCPAHHPLLKVSSVSRWHKYRPLRPLSALAATLSHSGAALVVPCDDRVVAHLHALYASLPASSPAAAAIRRSLGKPEGFAISERRSEFIAIAREEGVAAPEMLQVETAGELRDALKRVGLPAVLKVDGTWGGLGVVVVQTPEQGEWALRRLSRPMDATRVLKRLIIDRDPFPLSPWLSGGKPVVNVQRFIHGRPANSAVACWNGEVAAAIHVEVLKARTQTGNSTIVRVIDNAQMSTAAERIARRLGLSGFHGFDFLIEHGTGLAHLIEMNPRTTPLSHLALGPGRDLVSALSARLLGAPAPAAAAATANDVIAFFPQAWLLEPDGDMLNAAYHDVPWSEPDLVRELVKKPWPDRGLLAQLVARFRSGAETGPQFPHALRGSSALPPRPLGCRHPIRKTCPCFDL